MPGVPKESPPHADTIVTGQERLELSAVAAIVLRIEAKVDGVETRVRAIEDKLARQEGGDLADARNAERRTSESRWRKGVAVSIALSLAGVAVSVVLGLANLMLNSGG